MVSVMSPDKLDDGERNCRIHKFFGTDVVQCLEQSDCEWAMHFGQGRFCMRDYVAPLDNSRNTIVSDLLANDSLRK